jgi:DNA-binding NarL/FixJ family response regulator
VSRPARSSPSVGLGSVCGTPRPARIASTTDIGWLSNPREVSAARPEFLVAAVRTVHAGAAVIAPAAIGHLLDTFGRGRAHRDDELAVLGPREREIYDLTGRGLSNAEITAHEYVSEATVKTHVSRILAKLGLRDRVQLVVHWHRG